MHSGVEIDIREQHDNLGLLLTCLTRMQACIVQLFKEESVHSMMPLETRETLSMIKCSSNVSSKDKLPCITAAKIVHNHFLHLLQCSGFCPLTGCWQKVETQLCYASKLQFSTNAHSGQSPHCMLLMKNAEAPAPEVCVVSLSIEIAQCA